MRALLLVVLALLLLVLLALTRPVVGEERVLHCAETDSTGFAWQPGRAEGERTRSRRTQS